MSTIFKAHGLHHIHVFKFQRLYSTHAKNVPKDGSMYSVAHNSIHPPDFFGNYGNHRNFFPSLVSYWMWLIWIGMKQKKVFEKKNQNGRLKKIEIFNPANSQFFFVKFSGIGPWVGAINWCKRQQWGSTYLVVWLSDVSWKKG